jgi:hypothetical protein
MRQEPHADEVTDYHTLKAIRRGGTQSADTAAMEAMWQAIERGESKEEAEKQFSETYQKGLHDSSRSTQDSNRQ